MKTTRYIFILISLFAILSIFDRVTKSIVRLFGDAYSDTPRFIELVYACNPHSAFSIPIPWILVYTLCAVVIVIGVRMIFLFGKNQTSPIIRAFPYVLLIVGAVSNCVDRVLYGCVVDFISVGWWPIFNLADSYIVIAVVWIMFEEMFVRKTK